MRDDGQGGGAAGRPRGVAARRQGARPPGGEQRRRTGTVRLQLHLGATTVERLRVHVALSHRNDSKVADEILTAWLSRYGKGRELFGGEPPDDSGDLGVPGDASPAP